MLIGGDAAVGHFFYDHHRADSPSDTPHGVAPIPAAMLCRRSSSEVMVSQFAIQYGINTCCCARPWIMEKDDFRYSLSFR